MRVDVLITGRSYQTTQGAPPTLELAEGSDVDAALARLAAELSAEAQLPGECLLALNGRHLGTLERHDARTLRDGDELVIIAPVSGG